MSNMFLAPMSEQDEQYEGFFDGQNLTVPDNTELEVVVIDGFVGIEEGKSQQVCFINISVTTPGEFFGQKYKYNAKIYDMDANKRDLAMRNLGVLDAQAGHPMTNGQLPLTTENIEEHWSMKSEARIKMGLFISTTDANGNELVDEQGNPATNHINFIRGFAYNREKMIRQAGSSNEPQQTAEQQGQQQQQQSQDQLEDDIDF